MTNESAKELPDPNSGLVAGVNLPDIATLKPERFKQLYEVSHDGTSYTWGNHDMRQATDCIAELIAALERPPTTAGESKAEFLCGNCGKKVVEGMARHCVADEPDAGDARLDRIKKVLSHSTGPFITVDTYRNQLDDIRRIVTEGGP